MDNAGKAVLHAGESLHVESLVCPSGAYAVQHRADGTLVLRDNRAARDVWQIGAPVPVPGRFTLRPEGFLALEGASGTSVWSSGGVDPRVVSAMVKDDGRLVLIDPDGYVRWSRDPLSAEDLAAYRPARGDRLQRGEVLADSIASPDGQYTLTHTAAGKTLLRAPAHSDVPEGYGGMRHVWGCEAGDPGAAISLGPDGLLRVGTDSTVVQRWTGRYDLDPTSFTISAVVVRNEGDFVLLGEDGTEIDDSGTAVEEARLTKLYREFARREAERDAERAAGIGVPPDWKIEFPSGVSLLIRTDFSDDDAWRAVCEEACASDSDEFEAVLEFVDDRQLDGAPLEALLAAVSAKYFFVADNRTIADPEHPILLVKNEDPWDDDNPGFTLPRGATFRVAASHTAAPENNLYLSNMDFEEFANATDDDGVFRGFP